MKPARCCANPTEAARISNAPAADLTCDPGVIEFPEHCLREYNERPLEAAKKSAHSPAEGSALIGRGEITDKAYINQRAVLKHQAEQAEHLYCNEPDAAVIRV